MSRLLVVIIELFFLWFDSRKPCWVFANDCPMHEPCWVLATPTTVLCGWRGDVDDWCGGCIGRACVAAAVFASLALLNPVAICYNASHVAQAAAVLLRLLAADVGCVSRACVHWRVWFLPSSSSGTVCDRLALH